MHADLVPLAAFAIGTPAAHLAVDGAWQRRDGASVRVGRNRRWRARDAVVAPLPPRQREMLQRRRTGWS